MSYYRTDFVLCNHRHILVVDYMPIECLITFEHKNRIMKRNKRIWYKKDGYALYAEK